MMQYLPLTLLIIAQTVRCGFLSTFRTESLNIVSPSNRDCNGILEEAIYLMRAHFLKRHMYKDKDWKDFREEYSTYDNPHEAVRDFMAKFGDPYTRFIPKQMMVARQQCIRGQTVGMGLSLSRKVHFSEIGGAIQQLIPFSAFIFRANLSPSFTANISLSESSLSWSQHSAGTALSSIPSSTSNPSFPVVKQPMKSLQKFVDILWIKCREITTHLHLNFTSSSPQTSPSISFIDPTILFKRSLSEKARFAADSFCPIILAALYTKLSPTPLQPWQSKVLGVASVSLAFVSVARWLMPMVGLLEIVGVRGPASNCDIRPGDCLVSINGKGVIGWSTKKVYELLDDGEVGETLRIGILRKKSLSCNQGGDDDLFWSDKNSRNVFFEVEIVRDHILTQKVFSSTLPTVQGSGLGYLAIKEFTDKTFFEVTSAMEELRAKISMEQGCPMKGLIIDLRGNPGGPLPPALDLAALFLPRGKVLTQMSIEGKIEVHKSTNRRPDKKTDLLLLTDESTASASEIFVAALQDNLRAKCMGTRTVGKNVAQAMMMLSDGSGLAFTVREYFSPLGRIMSNGIVPDYEIAGVINVNAIRKMLGVGGQWKLAEHECLATTLPQP